MIKKKLFLFILVNLMYFSNASSQEILSIIKVYDNTLETNIKGKNKLILISSSGCGHCTIALRELKKIEGNLQIIIIDYGDKEEFERLKIEYDYMFLDGKKIEKLGYQDTFPKLYLYNTYDELIWKKKGWFNNNLEKIKSKTASK